MEQSLQSKSLIWQDLMANVSWSDELLIFPFSSPLQQTLERSTITRPVSVFIFIIILLPRSQSLPNSHLHTVHGTQHTLTTHHTSPST